MSAASIDTRLTGNITIGTRKQYAEKSAKWTAGQKTEDELLQRIWNLSGDVLALYDALAADAGRATKLEAEARALDSTSAFLTLTLAEKTARERDTLMVALADAEEHLRLACDIAGPRILRANLVNARRRARAALADAGEAESTQGSAPGSSAAGEHAPVGERQGRQPGAEHLADAGEADREATTQTFRRSEWVSERVDRFAASRCQSGWHDEGHSSHSACPSCGTKFMREYEIEQERKALENFVSRAEEFATATGWTRP